ncbi:hypothetical protein BACOV975_04497 [Bacteroides ovatus V975]|uniref:Uncharacterized protein n=1 Tax=Bacteroides ovatus (strain ATCC 8483 / DSM 1896 / JCM 5824 / BCRC 10623 / CCUG 4943 / NCTC 11153) TaxID=411476 RepID=A0AAN3A521_BACO1|nr:hypothetical protein BACOVA_04366 [Bacteroides ovatus ATCC 8483]SCV10703.1 hypothetical protein BACOV975_04497 [Bacteroides ovatus V975]
MGLFFMFMDLNSYLCTRKEVYNDCYKENKNSGRT